MPRINRTINRKSLRLRGYNYKRNGFYFVTFVTQNRLRLFGNIAKGKMNLNKAGQMVHEKIANISHYYAGVNVDVFIVMPDHIHMLIELNHAGMGQTFMGDSCAYAGRSSGMIHTYAGDSRAYAGRPSGIAQTFAGDSCAYAGRTQRSAPSGGNPRRFENAVLETRNVFDQRSIGNPRRFENAVLETRNVFDQRSIGNPRRFENAILETRNVFDQRIDKRHRSENAIYGIPDVLRNIKTYTTTLYIDGVRNQNWKPFYKRLWQRGYYESIIRDSKHLNNVRRYIINNPIKWHQSNSHQ